MWPRATDPVGRVPVTTVPAPVTVNERSTHRRTGASGSPAGARSARAASAARTPASPLPVRRGRDHRDRGEAVGRQPGERVGGGRSGVGEVGAGDDERDVGEAQGAHGCDVLLGLGAPALVGGDDQQHPGDRPQPGQRGADQPVVSRHVDDGHPAPVDVEPLLEGARDAVRAGFVSGGTRRNLEWVQPLLDVGLGVSDDNLLLLADAQTSGGLLVVGEVPGGVVVGETVTGPPRIALS